MIEFRTVRYSVEIGFVVIVSQYALIAPQHHELRLLGLVTTVVFNTENLTHTSNPMK